jgi:hypothetical protein
MAKVKILCLSIWYPLSMSRYFEKAMRHNEKIELKTTGPFTGVWIPWTNPQHPDGMNLPEKYAIPPDLPLPYNPNVGRVSYDLVKAQLGGWKPDIVLTIDAGINWVSKPSDGLVATIGTDPHVLDYSHARGVSDKFFNMQASYSEPNDIYLPYAYSQYDVYPEEIDVTRCYPDGVPRKDLDAAIIGLQYTHVPRVQLVEELRKRGLNVFSENGPVFDEARAIYNRARVGLNWSTMNDLNCRAFEIPAMKIYPVVNRVPDLNNFEFARHCWQFSNLNEAIEGVMWAKENPEQAQDIANLAYKAVLPHTYDSRVEQLLTECGYS